jgi:hypothetical protein
MGNVRSRHWSLVALLATALLLFSGLVSPAEAATKRAVSIAPKATSASAGAAVTFSGKLTRSPKGTVVHIQRKSGKKWVAVRNLKTATAAGAYTGAVAMPKVGGTFSFRAVATKTKKLRAATSRTIKIVVIRKVVATIKASKPIIQLHTPVTLSGTITPFVAGKAAFIQRFNGASWTIVTTAIISKKGTYARSFSPIASTVYRVYVPRIGYNAAAASASTKVTVSNGPVAPMITTPSLPDGRTETAYKQGGATVVLGKTGQAGTWAVTVGSLPPGLVLNSGTGAITGTPTTAGNYPFTVTFSETATALNASKPLSIHVDPIAKITTTSLPSATAFATYSQTLAKTGLSGTWTVSGGVLPLGITLDGATGLLSGKPTVSGDFNLTFKFTDSTNFQVTKALPLHVNPAPAPVITTTGSLPIATNFATYTPVQLAKTGNEGTWTITAGALPVGITMTPGGLLTGKTTTATPGDYLFTVKFTETESSTFDTQDLTLHVNAAPVPVITTTSLPNATAFAIYTASVVKTGNAGTWTITNGSLPDGILFDTTTGALSGKATESGDFPLTFKFTETESQTFASKSFSLHVNPAPDPVITTTSLPAGTEFRSYSTSVVKTGNAGIWSITSGSLPAGVLFDTATGAFTGKPTVAGNYPLTIKFTETESHTFTSKAFAILVAVAPEPVITTASLPNATAFANYTASVAVGAGALPGEWSITGGTLPAGIVFDTATGALSGKPTAAATVALTFTYLEQDSAKTVSKVLQLTVNPAANPVISTTSLPSGIRANAYSAQLAVSTGNPGTWSITGGGLPTGIELNPATGAITGTPSVGGIFPVTFTFTETESGTFASKAFSINILDNPVITTTSLPDGTRGSSYGNKQLTKTGGSGSGTWSISAGQLPTGLNLNGSTGVISGTPTVLTNAANENFTVKFSDSVTGFVGTKVLSIHIAMAGAPSFNTAPTLPAGTVGDSYSKTLSATGGLLARWSVDGGSLPPGITLRAIDGLISGTPTTPGDYAFVIRFGTTVPLTYNTRQFFIHVSP